jgi:hypothetical protein
MRYYLKINNLGLLFLSVFFICIVFDINIVSAQNTQTPTLFFSAPPTKIEEGEKFTIDVKINSLEQSINAVSGTLSFPATLVHVLSIGKDKSIINLWTEEPRLSSNRVLFEGIILNPGFQGMNGLVLHITFEAEKAGPIHLNFDEGSILANDGLGTNILATLGSINFNITPAPTYSNNKPVVGMPIFGAAVIATPKVAILPVITKFSSVIGPDEVSYIIGKGEPLALTKIAFQNISIKSLGEKLIDFLQNKKIELSDVIVNNDKNGRFHYISGADLIAGVYNATPSLIVPDKDTETPGSSVQLLVNDSVIVKNVVVVLNVMGLLIPIVLFGAIIFFIPWFSWRKIRVMKDKMLLEEEKIELTAEELKQKSTTPNS